MSSNTVPVNPIPGSMDKPSKPSFPKFKLSPLPLRILITAYVITLIIAVFIVAFLLQSIVWIATLPLAGSHRSFRIQLLGSIFRHLSIFVSLLNPFWRVKINGKVPTNRPNKLLVMSNHISNLDPFITCRSLFPWETKYISKSSLFNVPFGGWCMRLAGDIPVYFTADKGGWGLKKGSVAQLMDTCKDYVQNLSIPITVYPEGARSGGLILKDFKPGMFTFAVENDCHILPLGMIGTEYAWPVWTTTLDMASISVNIGQLIPPINDPNMTKEEKVAKLMSIVRERIQALMDELQKDKKKN